MGYSKKEKSFDELVDTNPMMHLLYGKREKFKNPYDEIDYKFLFGPNNRNQIPTESLEAIMPVPEKPDPIEEKIDKLNNKLDLIFGKSVLIHGQFVHINPLSATKEELKRFIK